MTRGWAPSRPPSPTPGDRARRWLAARLAAARTTPGAAAVGTRAGATSGVPAELLGEAVRRHLPAHTPLDVSREMTSLADALTGLGPLAAPARRPGVTDVLVDADGLVWTDGIDGLRPAGPTLSPVEARQLAVRLLAQDGRRLDEGQPYGDAQVAGARVHAVLPPIASGGTQISVRLAAPEPPTLDCLAAHWPQGEQWLSALRHVLGVRANLLISGATGSGKTTLLAALLSEAGPGERIITVEDTRELRPRHPHVVSLQARGGNAEGTGAVTLTDLVRQALRMRPDRLIVGECRGAEVADFLAAMNTGHRGAAGTLHANSARDVPARLQAMGALAGLGPEATALQAGSAVDAVLHVVRTEHGRRPVELAVLEARGPGGRNLRVVPALSAAGDGLRCGPGLATLEALGPTGGGRHALGA